MANKKKKREKAGNETMFRPQTIGRVAAQERGQNSISNKHVEVTSDPNDATLRLSEVKAMFELFNIKEGKAILKLDATDNLLKVMQIAENIVNKVYELANGTDSSADRKEALENRVFIAFKGLSDNINSIKERIEKLENNAPQAAPSTPAPVRSFKIMRKRIKPQSTVLFEEEIIPTEDIINSEPINKVDDQQESTPIEKPARTRQPIIQPPQEIKPLNIDEKIGLNIDTPMPMTGALVSEYNINGYSFTGVPILIKGSGEVVFGWKYAGDTEEMIKSITLQLADQGVNITAMSVLKEIHFEGVYVKFKGLNLDISWRDWVNDVLKERESS